MHTPKPLLALLLAASASMAQAEPLKIGLILPLTGPFASTGKQIEAGARLYMAQQGDTVADRKMLASQRGFAQFAGQLPSVAEAAR